MKAHTPSVPQGQAQTRPHSPPAADPPLSYTHRPDVGRRGPDPLEYQHRYTSLRDYAQLLVLRYHHGRTRHAYYRQLRLLSDHFHGDPATLSESQVRDSLIRSRPLAHPGGASRCARIPFAASQAAQVLHVKTLKRWKPKTIRQAAACARLFFVEQLGHQDWTVFSQIRARDQNHLPAVMTRDQVNPICTPSCLGPLFEDTSGQSDIHLGISFGALAVAGMVLIVVGLGAGLLPAWRSSRLDPVQAMRRD